MSQKKQTKSREISLDIMRSIAVLLMIWAHVVSFLYLYGTNYTSESFLNLTRNFGDTVCFTTFFFVSGASLFFLVIKKGNDDSKNWPIIRKKMVKRSLVFLLGYYLLAIITAWGSIGNIRDFLDILLLIDVPGFTEFLIPFILFTLIIIPFRKSLNFILKQKFSLFYILGIGAILYALGYWLYGISLDYPWGNYKALLAGQENIIRFPVLQYSL